MTCEDCADLRDELDALREEFQRYREDAKAEREAYRENVLEQRLDEVAATCDDARDERVELRETLARLQDRIQRLEAQQDALVGVQDPSESNPAQRAIDLRSALIRRAKARAGKNAGRAQAHHQDVRDILADHGHGSVSKPDRYRAMEEAAQGIDARTLTETEAPAGFQLVDGGATLDGRDVQAIRVQLETLPADWAEEATEPASRNATTPSEETAVPTAATDGGEPRTSG